MRARVKSAAVQQSAVLQHRIFSATDRTVNGSLPCTPVGTPAAAALGGEVKQGGGPTHAITR